MNWDDLRYLLVLARAATLARAAKAIGVDQSTVRRRLEALETSLGGALVDRRREGWRLTPLGERVVEHALRLESDVAEIARLAGADDDRPEGQVVLTAGEVIMAEFVVPYLGDFGARFPKVTFDLRVSNHVLDLARGEADLAVRIVRPDEPALVTRQVGALDVGLYASRGYLERPPTPALPLRGRVPISDLDELRGQRIVTYDRSLARSPEATWLASRIDPENVVARSSSPFAMMAAVRAGLGIGPLLSVFAERQPELVCVVPSPALPRRSVWLVGHPTSLRTSRVRAVWEHLAAAFEREARPTEASDRA
ncbi:LysR family transcriptional regulator [Pendulispora rubella]|uniref:LysR family transcriptional regulator n=1 Tax=Pendulispora rubella TaxID=2741070 RepID=A0ABZ2LFX9_9BACT